jgi:hypothetical protein
MKRHNIFYVACMFAAVWGMAGAAAAVTVTLPVAQDATLFQDDAGLLSGGGGQQLMVGNVGSNDLTPTRRTVIQFDTSAIPAGSVITAATLTLNAFKVKFNTNTGVEVHRVAASWNAGTVDPGSGGRGVLASPGDATWLHRSSPTPWANPGGDFLGLTSASAIVGGQGIYNWTGAGLAADLQFWVNNPGQNFGWILLGDETAAFTVKEFSSVESFSNRPVLTVTYTPIPEPGSVAVIALAAGCCWIAPRRRWRKRS